MARFIEQPSDTWQQQQGGPLQGSHSLGSDVSRHPPKGLPVPSVDLGPEALQEADGGAQERPAVRAPASRPSLWLGSGGESRYQRLRKGAAPGHRPTFNGSQDGPQLPSALAVSLRAWPPEHQCEYTGA